VTDAWGANTFPVRKCNSQTFHLKFVEHVFFPVFPTFSSNKRWWRIHTFSFLGRRICESHVALPPKGRLRQPLKKDCDENPETGQIQAKGPSGEGRSPQVEKDEGLEAETLSRLLIVAKGPY